MNPILLDLGFVKIRWYSVLVLSAFVIGYYMVLSRSRKNGISTSNITDMCITLVIICIWGARAYYCLFNLDYYKENIIDIFKIWEGGLAIHGGILVGILIILLFCKKYKFRFIRLLDFMAPALLLGQAIGRWGNFFNGEAHGFEVAPEILKTYLIPKFIIDGMTIDGVTYAPTFLYESFACLVLFILFMIIRKYKYLKVGTLSALYFMGYGIIRFFIEYQRVDALKIGDFRVAQVISVISFIVGLTILINNSRKGKLDDLYNDRENMPNIKY